MQDVNLKHGQILDLGRTSFFPSPKDITSQRASADNKVLEALRQQIINEIQTQYTEDHGEVVMTMTGAGKALTCLILQELRDAGWDAGFTRAPKKEAEEMQMWQLKLTPKGKSNA